MSENLAIFASPWRPKAADWSFRFVNRVRAWFSPETVAVAGRRIADLYGARPTDLRFLRLKTCFVFRDRAGYIYRMPANPRVVAGFRAEYEMLDGIRHGLPLPVPNAILKGNDPPVARYPEIPGEALPRVLDRLRQRGEFGWREQLGEWLAALHAAVPPPGSPATPILERTRTLPKRLRIRSASAGRTADDIEAAADQAARLLAARSGSDVLCHGDLKGGNLRVDVRKARITGVIDFSTWGLAPPEWDFVRLRLPEEDVAALIPIYERTAGRVVDRPLLEALRRLDDALALGRRLEDDLRRRTPNARPNGPTP